MTGDPGSGTQSDLLPTPFTAAQIRTACPAGLTLRYRVERRGEEPRISVTRYVSVDHEEATRESWVESLDGVPEGEVERDTSSWLVLQQHAAFPRATTQRTEEILDLPAGRFECSRYTRVDGNGTWRFWFARELPGQPVRFEQQVDQEMVMSSTLVSRQEP